MKRFLPLAALLFICFYVSAQDRDAVRRQLALVQPEAVSLALDDMATRWPIICGKTDRTRGVPRLRSGATRS